MLPKYREEKVILRDPILKLAPFFGITPFYNFSRHQLIEKNLCKAYGPLLAVAMAAAVLISFYFSQQKIAYISPMLTGLQSVMIITYLTLFLITAFGSSIWNMELWERMFNLLYRSGYHDESNGRYFLNIPLIFLIFGFVHGFILFAVTLYYLGIIFAGILSPMILLNYSKVTTVCVVYKIIRLLKNKYTFINNTITDVSFCTVIKSGTIKNLQKMTRIYMEADKILEIFNKIFAWPLFLILAGSVENLLISLAIFAERGIKLPENTDLYNEIVIINGFYAFLAVVSLVFVIK